MDRISSLSDDLLVHILSSLSAKDVVATTILSKRWKFLWTMVPKLVFEDNFVVDYDLLKDYNSYESSGVWEGFRQFVDRVMVLHKAPVLDTLKFDVGPLCNSEDMAHWVRAGIVRHVRELDISHDFEYFTSISLPRSLYTYAELEVLKLSYSVVLAVPTHVYLPSLKSLHLLGIDYETEQSLRKLLSGCPVLEELVLDKGRNIDTICFYIESPSLERLSILDVYPDYEDTVKRLVINAPSLRYLNIVDTYCRGLLCSSENMPEVVEAKLTVIYNNVDKLMASLTSVKRLSLCLFVSLPQYHIRFYQLVHLELCGGALQWWDLLTWMLESSPKLQVLKLDNCNEKCHEKCYCYAEAEPIEGCWGQPHSVPECLRLQLNTFEWKWYNGRKEEKKLAAYILKNARQLKSAAFSSRELIKKNETKKLKELVSLARTSSACQLHISDN